MFAACRMNALVGHAEHIRSMIPDAATAVVSNRLLTFAMQPSGDGINTQLSRLHEVYSSR